MANDPPEALCPPHHWLITRAMAPSDAQLWVCQRCASRKELTPADLERGHSWQGMRGRRGQPS